MKTCILTLLGNNFEEIETAVPLDIWRRAGYDVTLASITNQLEVTGLQKLTITADTLLADCSSIDYDILFIPGGAGVKFIQESELAMSLIQAFIDQNKKIVAICAAVTVLAPWLENKKATCYPAMKEMIPSWIDQPVAVDLPFITSQGPGTAHNLAFALIELINGKELMLKIQKETVFN